MRYSILGNFLWGRWICCFVNNTGDKYENYIVGYYKTYEEAEQAGKDEIKRRGGTAEHPNSE